jgi:3-hydroxybutyryl-CoA dehydrogenase
MVIEDVRNILVAGAGTMGTEISLQFAVHGYNVIAYDIEQDILNRSYAKIRQFLTGLVSEQRVPETQVEAVLKRITMTTDLSLAASHADLVSESIPEQLTLKKQLFTSLSSLCPRHTIFTTNSSRFVPSQLATASGRPDRFAAMHFHSRVWVSNVVDIMGSPQTSPKTLALLADIARQIGQIPLTLKKEYPGYLFNSMILPLLTAALTLVQQGVASCEDVDRAWMGVMKAPIGPFGILDRVGLDVARDIMQYTAFITGDKQTKRNVEYLSDLVDAGREGMKNGRGFYGYPGPAFANLREFLGITDEVDLSQYPPLRDDVDGNQGN